MRFSFIHDRLAMPLRHYIGLDILMWGSDFPHSVGTFPDSRYVLEELFEDIPEAERRQVLVENPCELFGLDPDHELTPTP
jgi:predicted TIM-barrel fold metal-dependent hydrolase